MTVKMQTVQTNISRNKTLITESQVKQLYAVGINAGFDAKIIDGQIQKKFNKI